MNGEVDDGLTITGCIGKVECCGTDFVRAGERREGELREGVRDEQEK